MLKINSNFHIFSEANEREDQIPTNEGTPESIDIPMTPQPVRALIFGERGDSSVVKYKITATPGYVGIIILTFRNAVEHLLTPFMTFTDPFYDFEQNVKIS